MSPATSNGIAGERADSHISRRPKVGSVDRQDGPTHGACYADRELGDRRWLVAPEDAATLLVTVNDNQSLISTLTCSRAAQDLLVRNRDGSDYTTHTADEHGRVGAKVSSVDGNQITASSLSTLR